MNKQATMGMTMVIAAGVLAGLFTVADGGVAEGLVGKAIWYLPYVVLVGGLRTLANA